MKKVDREKVLNKYGCRCGYCGESIALKTMQIDHIIPQYRFDTEVQSEFRIPLFLKHLKVGDVDHFDNLMPACRVCNKWKSAFDIELFRDELGQLLRQLREHSSQYRMAKKYAQLQDTPKPIVFYFETQTL